MDSSDKPNANALASPEETFPKSKLIVISFLFTKASVFFKEELSINLSFSKISDATGYL